MKLNSGIGKLKEIKASSLIYFCTQSSYEKDPYLKELNKELSGAIKKVFESKEFEGKLNQTAVLHTVSSLGADRIILAGLGEKEKITDDSYRQAAGTLSRLIAVKKSQKLAFFFGAGENDIKASAVTEGFYLGQYSMQDYKTGSDDKNGITEIMTFYGTSKSQADHLQKGMNRGEIIADGVILSRRLAAHPGNVLPPRIFADEAASQAKKYRIKVTVLDEKKILAERMGALLAVGHGSDQPSRFVILEYNGGSKSSRPVVLVGKGITFDSGGISIKPSADMDEMKGDMTGGAIMLAAIVTAARLKLPLNIVTLIPLAENMPSGKALRPGDIIKSRKGKTIEILSTDAEGRLILADALDYANKFKPQAVIDMATLTGASLFILGHAGIPILGNNKKLLDAFRAASESTAEKVWELPIWDEHREQVKSSIADLKNSGGRPAGTITATAFLENFIGEWPWVHIDIASVDLEKAGKPYIPKGPSGTGLRLIVELLARWKKI
jgi:leucyl aminopeptidase